MQATGPSLPEFHPGWFCHVAAPIWGPVPGVFFKFDAQLFFFRFQPFTAFDYLALGRSPGADAAAFGAAVKIVVADL